jgi:hypothetical protein
MFSMTNQFLLILLSLFFSSFSCFRSINFASKFSKSVSLYDQQFRIGHGYDIHRLVEGNKLVVAGVYIPYKMGADAHSDGDAVYHR